MEASIKVLSVHKALFCYFLKSVAHWNVNKDLEKAEKDDPDQINLFQSLACLVHVVAYQGCKGQSAQKPHLAEHD